MTDRAGFIAVSRGLFDHPAFAPEPFSEREAWVWMIAEAAWKPTTARVGRAVISLQRGQLAFSTRFLAAKWQWSEARVRRFLSRIASSERRTGDAPADALVTLETTRDATRVTICNYEKYQNGRRTGDAPADAPVDAQPYAETTQRITSNQKPEDSSGSLRSPEPCARERAGEFDRWYREYPHKVGRKAAEKAFAVARKAGASFEDLETGLRRYIRTKPPDRPWCNPATWLNQGRWADEPSTSAEFKFSAPGRGPQAPQPNAYLAALDRRVARRAELRHEQPSGEILDLDRDAWRDGGPGNSH